MCFYFLSKATRYEVPKGYFFGFCHGGLNTTSKRLSSVNTDRSEAQRSFNKNFSVKRFEKILWH